MTKIALAAIFLLTAVLYIFLMVKDTIPTVGLAGLAVLWLIFLGLRNWKFLPTPMDWSIITIFLMLAASLAISIDWSLSLPKVFGLLLGVSFFYWIVYTVNGYNRLRLVILALIPLSLAMAILGVLGSGESTGGITLITRFTDLLPRLTFSIPRATYGGINPNTIGGALTFFLPLLASLLWDGGAFRRKFVRAAHRNSISIIVYKVLLGLAFLVCGVALLLTQSRGAYLGSAIGLLILAIWRDRRFLWSLPILLVGVLVVLYFSNITNFPELIALLDTNEDASIPGRLEAWRNAIYLIKDFPFTGVGISTYNRLFDEMYTFVPFTLQGAGSFHPHNTLLGVAIDLGIPAVVLYTYLLGSITAMVFSLQKVTRSIARYLLLGAACGLLAHQVFGITDAYLLGTKLGVIMWVWFGIITAVYAHRGRFRWVTNHNSMQSYPGSDRQGKTALSSIFRSNSLLTAFGWVLVSLAAVTFINQIPWLSLVLAAVGGFALGILFVHNDKEAFAL